MEKFSISRILASLFLALAFICLVVLVPGCARRTVLSPDANATDYSLDSSWYDSHREVDDKLVDVFYVLPTCVFDTKDDSGNVLSRFADVNDPGHRQRMKGSYDLAMEIFADSANFFAPYYRHVSLDVWMDGVDTISKYAPVAMEEVRRSFDYYLEHMNGGRPIVLAGFSQGGMGVVHLLKSMSDEVFNRVIAAYVCGYKVTESDLQCPHIIPAKGADDRGVTIVYNSVSGEEGIAPVLSEGNLVTINPLSWSTSHELVEGESFSARISDDGSVVIVEGVNPMDYYNESLSRLFPLGNLHLGELTLYEPYLRENVKLRTRK